MRALFVVIVATLAACRTTPVGPYTPPAATSRSTSEAERINRLAADLLDGDPAKAEELLRQALTADLYYGPAHNNLGVLYLKHEKLYEAANEFEWARKLMPGHPDPRVNLALTLERAGKTDEAMQSYGSALATSPEYLPAVLGIASLTVKSGHGDERLARWLDDIAQRSDEPAWRDWATTQRMRLR